MVNTAQAAGPGGAAGRGRNGLQHVLTRGRAAGWPALWATAAPGRRGRRGPACRSAAPQPAAPPAIVQHASLEHTTSGTTRIRDQLRYMRVRDFVRAAREWHAGARRAQWGSHLHEVGAGRDISTGDDAVAASPFAVVAHLQRARQHAALHPHRRRPFRRMRLPPLWFVVTSLHA